MDPEPCPSGAGWALRPASAVMSHARSPPSAPASAPQNDACAASHSGSAADAAAEWSNSKALGSNGTGLTAASADPEAEVQPFAGPSEAHSTPSDGMSSTDEQPATSEPWHLFAFPLESNFSGVRYDEALGAATEGIQCPVEDGRAGGRDLEAAQQLRPEGPPRWRRGRWAVLLDAAKGCGSRPPDLSKNPVDFVVRHCNA